MGVGRILSRGGIVDFSWGKGKSCKIRKRFVAENSVRLGAGVRIYRPLKSRIEPLFSRHLLQLYNSIVLERCSDPQYSASLAVCNE